MIERAGEVSKRRHMGMSEQAKQAVAEATKDALWSGECRHCHARITATKPELLQGCPNCGVVDDNSAS